MNNTNVYKKKKKDWYKKRKYPHFDEPLCRKNAWSIVKEYRKECKYGFYPLIQFELIHNRYRTKKLDSNRKIKIINKEKSVPKIRIISYPSHKDGYIYSYYAYDLSKYYEKMLENRNIKDCVCAYRANIGSNIDIAGDVFKFIKNTKNCICLAYDIEKFFDSLDHKLLKKQIEVVLEVDKLPNDYYKIFKSITKYAFIKKDDLPKDEKGELYKPVCNPKQLREIKNKLYINNENYGIPQGTQISALLSNIYMIDFDVEISKIVVSMGGLYKRYADDIIIIIPIEDIDENLFETLTEQIKNLLVKYAGNLHINEDKTEKIIFYKGKIHRDSSKQPLLQYLGLTYDGSNILVRNSSLSRNMRKMLGGIRRKIHLSKTSKKFNGKIFKTYIYHQYSHLGNRNFYNYIRNICDKLSHFFRTELKVKHQTRKHMSIIRKETKGIRTTKHHKKYKSVDF